MGQSYCSTCACGEATTEVDLKASLVHEIIDAKGRKSVLAQELANDVSRKSSEEEIVRVFAKFEGKLRKIQAVWRGYRDRQLLRHVSKVTEANHAYFHRNEVWETLRRFKVAAATRDYRPVYVYKSGANYIGQWRGGFRDGFGTITYPDGAKYEGNWSWGTPFQAGKFTHIDGEEYEGLWKQSRVYGRVSLLLSGRHAIDTWKSGLSDGFEWLWYKAEMLKSIRKPNFPISKLEEIRVRLSKIKVMIDRTNAMDFDPESALSKVGLRELRVQTNANGSVYEGEFLEEMKDGVGQWRWPNGDLFIGEWKHDDQTGWGKNIWADGSSYVGCFKANKKDGLGEYKWEEGSSYLGEWLDDTMHGTGEYRWADGRSYLGEWSHGLMQGFGKFTWQSGKTYEGGWFQGKKHGEGRIVNPDGTTTTTVWKAGKQILS